MEEASFSMADFREKFDMSWIYHDCGLEGIVLSYHEIKAAIDRKVASDNHLLPTYTIIKNLKSAMDFIREQAARKSSKVNVQMMRDVHAILVKGFEKYEPGAYRKDIPIHRNYFHEISPPQKVSARIDKLMELVGTAEFRAWHPIKQAAAFHHEFMGAFPFTDHSGQVGRLLMNYFLLKGDYLPAVIHAVDRQRYYESLRGTNSLALREHLVDALENALESAVVYFRDALKISEMQGSQQEQLR
ncbi:MAG: Fic family protein, partial [Myxococcota bacterium]